MILKKRLKWYFDRKIILFFLFEKRFLNPLVAEDNKKLNSSGILDDDCLWNLIENIFPKYLYQLPVGMYFPVPICKSIEKGENFTTDLALKFHYDFIKIDENHKWSFKQNIIKGTILKLFKSNLYFERETNLYFIEYQSDNRWDKCYLEASITPIIAISFFYRKGKLMIHLNNQKTDSIDMKGFRIDKKERCFTQSKNFGEVLLADAPRFWLLNHLDASGKNLIFQEEIFSLRFS